MVSHISKYAPPHAERGFVSFGSDLLSGGGGSRELLSARILLLYAEVSFVLFLMVYRRQKARRHTDKIKPSHLGNFRLLFKVRFKGVQLQFINHLPKMFIKILHCRIPDIQKKTRLFRLYPGTKTLRYHLNFFLRMEFETKGQG